jgi:nucleoid-associated protein YgaU
MNTTSQMMALREAQKGIRDQMKRIVLQLKNLENKNIPDSQPWISFNRVQTIEELRSPFRSVKETLKNDLSLLQSRLRELEREAWSLNIKSAKNTRTAFEMNARRKLKEFEKTGSIPDGELAGIRAEAESVLRRFINILNSDPSEENIRQTLNNLVSPLMFGTEISTGIGKEAFDAISKASEKVVEKSENSFRKNPTTENLDKFLKSKANAQLLGGDSQELPSGFKPANTTHQVKQGDSLSSISSLYYGNTAFWDMILIANVSVIGNNPNNLRIGTELRIP